MGIGACIISVSGPVLLSAEEFFLRTANPWGVILMARSCKSVEQVQALTQSIKSAVGRDCLIFIDQEGGRVARLKAPVWPKFPAAALYGDLYSTDPDLGLEACRTGHRLMAHELYSLGIQADCAPVCDVRYPDTHDAIGDRAFAADPEGVAALARAALEGLALGGVLGVIKHMPGQGRSTVDSHHDLPRVEADKTDLDSDFSVFEALSASALMGMTGHVSYEALDPGQATTVSKTMISDTIRDRIGFQGLLMTDDLGMEALGGTLTDRGQRALSGGCDILLHCSGFLSDPSAILKEMEEVAAIAGDLSGEAADRAAQVDGAIPAPDSTDIGMAREKLDRLLVAERPRS